MGTEQITVQDARTVRASYSRRPYPRTVYPIVEVGAAVAAPFAPRHGGTETPRTILRPGEIPGGRIGLRLTGATQRVIGEHYGGITSAADSRIRRKIRDGKYPIADLVEQTDRNLTRGKLNI